MVVKNQIKRIKSLQQKKYRNQYGMFVVEGVKTVKEFLESDYKVDKIYVTQRDVFNLELAEVELVTQKELTQMSGLHAPNCVLGVFYIAEAEAINFDDWILALDDVRDPGNLGTIIRLCDWYGVKHLVCSKQTVDCYNPKVLQATMGSLTKVNVAYTDLELFLSSAEVPVYGTFIDGVSVSKEQLAVGGILVMGNEAHGIGARVEVLVAKRISISQYGGQTAESLNVAAATAIFLNEIRRK